MNKSIFMLPLLALLSACSGNTKEEYASYEDYPTFKGEWKEMSYTPDETKFMLWAPTADSVRLSLYDEGVNSPSVYTSFLKESTNGQWTINVAGDLKGKFYTFNVHVNKQWMGETPGVMAKAVGVNGRRAAILDLATTNPEGWEDDQRPELKSFADIMLYEMHHRDFSASTTSGIKHGGKFLALTENDTHNCQGQATGLSHLKELGITHVHLLPSYDYASVDETKLNTPQYNWGYDPQNYNVPDGSYSTDPYNPVVRIREFKQMVQSLHQAGIRVIMDVVYNHTFNTEESNFERTVPGYFYRHTEDGGWANGSGCGNETASNREMMRHYMIESVCYWVKEYHVDGFRFDLMGIHDLETMKAIRKALTDIDPSIFIYGEGWAAGSPAYPAEQLAMKANTWQLPGVAAFSDEFRDGLRGAWTSDEEGAFVIGRSGFEPQVMFGITGALPHPQLKDSLKNYPQAWTTQPTQMISYVSCHDDHCIADRLKLSAPNTNVSERRQLLKLAETAVFTSQGVPFIFAGDEIMRDKKGVKNSYCSSDSINVIDWQLKKENLEVFNYVKGLIALRKAHPAFRLGNAESVYKHLEFIPSTEGVVTYRIKGNPKGETWKDITVILNSKGQKVDVEVPTGEYSIICYNGNIQPEKALFNTNGNKLSAAPHSATIAYRK